MLKKYRLFGITIETAFPFTYHLAKADINDPIDICLSLLHHGDYISDIKNRNLLYQSTNLTKNGDSVLSIYNIHSGFILNFNDIVRFFLLPQHILYQPLDNFTFDKSEIYLLSSVLAIWLELYGTVCLHASTVVVNGHSLTFLSNSGGGKSTLALNMMQAGHVLLSDDILPVKQVGSKFMGWPAFPTLRLWPAQAEYFIGSANGLVRIHLDFEKRLLPIGTGIFGEYAREPAPLGRLYLIERRSEENNPTIEISSVQPAQALIELLRQSFVAKAVEGLGLAKQRLKILAALVQKVSMRRLVYPNGFEYLPEIRQAILDDFERI